jgi:hypothetical protein
MSEISDDSSRFDGPARDRHLALIAGITTIIFALAILALVPQLRHCVSLTAHGDLVRCVTTSGRSGSAGCCCW